MSDVAIATTTTPISPAHPNGQGNSKPGGHIQAWRAQPAFPAEAKLNIIGGNLWRPGTPAHRFYEEVLSQGPMSVQECIDKAGALAEPFTAKAVQGHLRWMFTANGAFLEVDGVRFVAPTTPVMGVEKPVQEAKVAKVAKTKKAKKAEAKEVEAA